MRTLNLLVLIGAVALPTLLPAQQPAGALLEEYDVEWGGRTRDPYVAPDGKVWFVGQQGNYVASFDPASKAFRRYEIEEGTNPHTVIVDQDGIVWYAGNRNGRIGRLDPATGAIRTFMTGDARDPHTMTFDGRGNIWFTAQGSNRLGRLEMATGKVDLIQAADQPSNPYGIVMDRRGIPTAILLRTNQVVKIDPQTLELTRYEQANPASRSRRLAVTSDGMIWYGDEARGFIGRIDPETGETKEWQAPGGASASPYALIADDRDRIWFSETGPQKKLVGFDPRTEQFFADHPVSGTIRQMTFDPRTRSLWFGTDANRIGRLIVD